MIKTRSGDPARQARAWLARHGQDLAPLPAPALDLLQRRLAARRAAARWVLPLQVPALAALAVAFWLVLAGTPDGTGLDGGPAAWWYRAGITVALLAAVLAQQLAARADDRVAATLPRRVARGEHVGARTVLGRWAAATVVAAASLMALWCLLLMLLHRPALAGSLAAWGALGATSAALGLRRALGRPAVAQDAVTLALDERLRSREAADAVMPLVMTWVAAVPGQYLDDLGRWTRDGLIASFVLVMVLNFVSTQPRTWPRPEPSR